MATTKTTKQKIIDMLQRLPDDIDYERAIEGIVALRGIDAGLAWAARGEAGNYELLQRELLGEDELPVPHHSGVA
jgi:hypothetical protein